jgi:SAM-dependent methyltransferase
VRDRERGADRAAAGAEVTGLDAASRLIDVARARAAAAGAGATFVAGDALDLPFEDGAFDVALSVFGIIFVPDAERALAEVVRVLRRGGRALISAWIPAGAIREMVEVLARGVAAAGGPERPGFGWQTPRPSRRSPRGSEPRSRPRTARSSSRGPRPRPTSPRARSRTR